MNLCHVLNLTSFILHPIFRKPRCGHTVMSPSSQTSLLSGGISKAPGLMDLLHWPSDAELFRELRAGVLPV